MQKVIPNRNPALLSFALEVAAGADQYGAAIPLKLNPAAEIRLDIAALVNSITAHGQASTELRSRRAALAMATQQSRAFLTLARDNAKPVKGNRYNPGWDGTGLKGSLYIPRGTDEVLPLLLSFKEFLTANPSFEVAPQNVTAARARQLYEQLDAARNAVNQQAAHIGNLRLDRDAKAKALRKRMQFTISELNQRIEPLDMRWLAFGLNRPGLKATPEVPANVTVVMVGPNAAEVKWDPAVRAAHYRVWMRIVGSNPEWVAVGSPADPDFTIEPLPGNSDIEVAVSAVSPGGESARSASSKITTFP